MSDPTDEGSGAIASVTPLRRDQPDQPEPPRLVPQDLTAYLRLMRQRIDQHGAVVQHVLPAFGGDLGYSYTLGLTDAGLPELWIGGLRPSRSEALLLDAARMALEEGGIAPGELRLAWSTPFRVRGPVAVEEAAPFVAQQVWPHPYVVSVMQVCWPDTAGRFPDDDGYDEARFPQQLLALRGSTL